MLHSKMTVSDAAEQSPSPEFSSVIRTIAAYLPAAVLAVTLVSFLVFHQKPWSPDVSGQFYTAQAMRDGARLYIDIIEINPPLWFWMAIPLSAVAEFIGTNPEPVIIVATALLTLAAISAARAILRVDETPKALFLAYSVVVLLILPMYLLEQREHLALIASIPYIILAAARRTKDRQANWLAFVVGVGAAPFFALKPFFLFIPMFLEVWLAFALRRNWRPFRPETIALPVVGLIYAVALLTFTPTYFTRILPDLLPVYRSVAPPFADIIGAQQWVWFLVLLVISANRTAIMAGRAPNTVAFVLGGFAFSLSFLMQHQGWAYQSLPATACFSLALAAMVMEAGWPANLTRLFVPALLAWPLVIPLGEGRNSGGTVHDLAPAVRDLHRGDPIGLISKTGLTDFSAFVNQGLRQSSRYTQYWMVAAPDRNPDDPAVQRAAHRAVLETVQDFRCVPPKRIVFVRLVRGSIRHPGDDPFPFFMSHPAFAALMQQYRLTQRYGIFDVYYPKAAIPPRGAVNCR